MAGIMYEKEETAVSRAILNNDITSLKAALMDGEDPHFKDRKGNTYLHYVCTMHRPFLIHFLVGSGIDLNAQNRHGNTALHVTALQNECSHVGDLMAAGIDSTLRNNNGKTAAEIPAKNLSWRTIYDKYQPGIFEAVAAHDVDKVLHLLHCWSRVYTKRNGLTLRHFAAAHKFHDIVFHIDFHRHTLGAIYAVLEGDEKKAKNCMSQGKCDINYVNHAMESKHILQEALKQRSLPMVHAICQSRVQVNLTVRIHNYLKAPLFFAALDPKLSGSIMWTVLKAGADFSLRDERGRNAGIYALDKSKGKVPIDVIHFMLKKGLDISQRDETGVTLRDVVRFMRRRDILTLIDKAYVKLIRTTNLPELERLCMRGYDGMLINFNYRDTFIYASGNETEEALSFIQWIPKFVVRRLFYCIRCKSLEEVISVLDACEKPRLLLNAVDKGGRAAIHKCVLCWRSVVLRELIRRKCDVNLQDNSGRTAYHYACALEEEDERRELCSILTSAGIDEGIGDYQGHKAELNVDNKKAQHWLSKERKTVYGMVKQITCVDKYEELCRMMKYRKKNLKHFKAAVCRFKYSVPRFEEVLQPLMSDYRDLLFVSMETGKEDIAVYLVQLGANWRRVEKIKTKDSEGRTAENEEEEEVFMSVCQKAKELGMQGLINTIERQKSHQNKVLVEKRKEREDDGKSKISKIRKFASVANEKKSQDAGDDEDVLFEEEVVSDSDDSENEEEDKNRNMSDGKKINSASDEEIQENDDENFELSGGSDVSFYSDDFDL